MPNKTLTDASKRSGDYRSHQAPKVSCKNTNHRRQMDLTRVSSSESNVSSQTSGSEVLRRSAGREETDLKAVSCDSLGILQLYKESTLDTR